MPPYLSEDCRDLIQRMLLVDPIERITLAEVREHPWFQVNLPPELCHPPEPITSRKLQSIDDQVLQLLMKVVLY
jgi:5'-AMP-activated protein kinase, catalytic alpha subunit